MNRATILFLVFAMSLSACSEDEVAPLQSCNTQNVLVDLPWLAELIEEQEQSFIGQNYAFITTGKINKRRVFFLQNCCPNCSSAPPDLLDCSGNVLGVLGTKGFELDDIENYEVIWKSSENSCAFSE